MAYLAASIDIGSWSVKVTFGKVGVKSVQVTDFREVRVTPGADGLPAPEEISRAIAECLGEMPKKPEAVFAALPGKEIYIRYLKLPKVGMKRLDQLAIVQIEDDLPVEMAEYIVDAAPLRDAGDGKFIECIVAAARKDSVRQAIEQLAGRGLDPAEVTCSPSFFQHVAQLSSAPAAAGPTAFIEMGHGASELVIAEGGKPLYYRSIMWGGKNITEKIASHFAITFQNAEGIKEEHGAVMSERPLPVGSMEEKLLAVCREAMGPFILDLRQSIMSYMARSGGFPARLVIFGGTAGLKGIEEYLRQSLNIETQVARGEGEQSPRAVRSRALLEGVVRQGEKRLNFRKGELTYQGKLTVVRRRWIRAVAFAAAVIVGWFLYSMAQVSTLESVIENQHKELAEITTQITGDKIDSFERGELLLKKSATARSPVPRQDAFDILDTMSMLIPEDVVHDVEELDLRSDRWRIRGIVDSIGDRDKIYEALVQYKDCIKSISKGKTTLSQKDNRQKYNFDMEVTCP